MAPFGMVSGEHRLPFPAEGERACGAALRALLRLVRQLEIAFTFVCLFELVVVHVFPFDCMRGGAHAARARYVMG